MDVDENMTAYVCMLSLIALTSGVAGALAFSSASSSALSRRSRACSNWVLRSQTEEIGHSICANDSAIRSYQRTGRRKNAYGDRRADPRSPAPRLAGSARGARVALLPLHTRPRQPGSRAVGQISAPPLWVQRSPRSLPKSVVAQAAPSTCGSGCTYMQWTAKPTCM